MRLQQYLSPRYARPRQDNPAVSESVLERGDRLEQFGPCRMDFRSCQQFVYSNDAQFRNNCGHSRSMHIH